MKTRHLSIFICALFVLLLTFPACAQKKITASVTVTNLTTNGMVFTYNGNTRTFTNNVFNSATQVLTNSDVTGCGSKTNLLTQLRSTPFSQTFTVDTGSNSFNVIGNADLSVALTVSAGYASVSYSTQTVSDMVIAQVPVSALPTALARTNVASGIAGALNAVENTNPVHQISLAASELMGLTNSQLVSGLKRFTNAASEFWGAISNSPGISGVVVALAGGLFTAPTLDGATITNGVNYGNAFSSPNNVSGGEQFGNGAIASGSQSSSFGYGALASGNFSSAIGTASVASGLDSFAGGFSSTASGSQSSATGFGAVASGLRSSSYGVLSKSTTTNSTAIGFAAVSSFTNSTAIGANSSNTAPNQVMLGGIDSSVVVPNGLTIQGGLTVLGGTANASFTGTNNYLADADIAFTRKAITSLGNGNNTIDVGTNVFIEVSGASADFTIASILNGRDGKLIVIVNQTGFNMTIAHQSAFNPTAATRIISMTGADRVTAGNGVATLIYSGAASRWLLINFDP